MNSFPRSLMAALAAAVLVPLAAAEVFAAWRAQSFFILAMTLAVAAAAAVVLILWHRNAKAHYRARFHAEKALRESEDRYRCLFERSRDAIYIHDVEGRFLDANDSALALMGYERDEIPHVTFATLVSPEELPLAFETAKEILSRGYQEHLTEFHLRTKTGETRIVETMAALLRHEGEPRAFLGVARDITDRKRMEEALRESEQRFRDLAELLPQTVYEINAEGRITFANRQGRKTFGYTQAEFEAMGSCFQILAPHERERARKNMQRVVDRPNLEGNEYTAQRKDGTQFPVVVYSAPVLRQDTPVGLRGIVIDISERKQAEEALRAEKDRARQYLDVAGMMMVALDANANVVLVNRKACEILGYEEPEILGKDWFEHFLPERVCNQVREVFARMMAGQLAADKYVENAILSRSGEERLIAWHNAVLHDPSGAVVGALSSGEDITERRRAEESLAEKVEELAALNTLARAVSATLAMEAAAKAALAGMLRAVHSDLAFLFLRDGERFILQDVLPSTSRQRLGIIPEHRAGKCLCGLAMREKKPVYSRDILNDGRCTWEECKRAGIKSLAVLPMTSGDEVIGVIGLASDTERDFERQGGFLETLAGQVSVGLINVRLYEAAQRELADRKRAETALREEKDKYRLIVETAGEGIWFVDAEYRTTYVNRQMADMLGYCVEEMLGRHVVEFLFEEDVPDHLAQREGRMRGMPARYEQRFRRKDGSECWTAVSATSLRDAAGRFTGAFGMFTDITARKVDESRCARSSTSPKRARTRRPMRRPICP